MIKVKRYKRVVVEPCLCAMHYVCIYLIIFGPLRNHIAAKNNHSPVCAFPTNRVLVSVDSWKSKFCSDCTGQTMKLVTFRPNATLEISKLDRQQHSS